MSEVRITHTIAAAAKIRIAMPIGLRKNRPVSCARIAASPCERARTIFCCVYPGSSDSTREAGVGDSLESETAEPGVVVRPPAEGPVVLAILDMDRQVIDRRMAHGHQPVLIELPVLVAVG